jgi:hypothetical protein
MTEEGDRFSCVPLTEVSVKAGEFHAAGLKAISHLVEQLGDHAMAPLVFHPIQLLPDDERSYRATARKILALRARRAVQASPDPPSASDWYQPSFYVLLPVVEFYGPRDAIRAPL